ncbi:carboxymuconolactone decarboxylase family protein [Novosphingobium cyanobacteriorum]|uniref:Carboxymuconolactone decarboxylase family protein n=1 Tax=Novosphingobium cyanobacteriorum TaxID=3024215 RepID=A0ABT6CNE0_9SPHN|nr:carboxymuconolactone decarboxylase family protein [Novosphingobium cyanobacteriorum]MDF8335440.1 carboxymuconolactone decarboxylase family protein [Novosphingobium cyanobacteriorum]
MSRITLIEHDGWSDELRALTHPETMSTLERGTLRIMAHKPKTAAGFVQFFGALRGDRTLPERMAELMRLRIAFHNQCRSCMAIRYAPAAADGVDEDLVCSLERPAEAEDLTEREKLAIDYGERLATNHLSIDDAYYEKLKSQFTEAEIVELGVYAAICIGMGRLAATWDMVEELPKAFQQRSADPITPWKQEEVIGVR